MITIRNLRKIYRSKEKTVEALKGVDLTVNQGDFIAVCGRSGAGKSTLLHVIGCLDGDFEGEYTFLGENIKTLSESKKAKLRNRAIGFVLQEYGLINDESVLENVMLPLRFGRRSSEREKKERARAALEKVGIADLAKSRADEISGGQRQRAAIARALVTEPNLLLADEPTGALDTKTAAELMALFRTLNEEGMTIIVVTHDDAVAAACSRTLRPGSGTLGLIRALLYYFEILSLKKSFQNNRIGFQLHRLLLPFCRYEKRPNNSFGLLVLKTNRGNKKRKIPKKSLGKISEVDLG